MYGLHYGQCRSSTQSPYGAPPSYPAFNNEESFGSLGRYDSKPVQSAGQPPAQGQSAIGGTYGSQGLHGFLGMNNAQAGSARPQASNASEDCLPPLAPTPPLPMPTLPLPLVPLVPMVLAWPKRSGRLTNPPPFRPNSKGSRASNNKVLEAILTVEATVVRTGDSTVVIMDLGPCYDSSPTRSGLGDEIESRSLTKQ